MPTYHVENFGCRATQADGAALERQFEARGLTHAAGAQADIVVLNTCTVTTAADQDARAAIRRVQRQNPAAKIIVTGCYAQRAPHEIAALSGVTAVVGNSHKHQLADLMMPVIARSESITNREGHDFSRAEIDPQSRSALAAEVHAQPTPQSFVPLHSLTENRELRTENSIYVSDIFAHTELLAAPVFESASENSRTRPNLKVQDGCDNRCSFCVIPSVRGHSRSMPLPRIIEEVKALVAAGYKELVVSGINLGRWGFDLPTNDLPNNDLFTNARASKKCRPFENLLRTILKETDLQKLRISSVEPMDWSDDLINFVASSPRIAKHAHVPLQSGSDAVLRRMHRKYRPWHYREKIEKIRAAMPTAAIGADVMTGFPGETDAEFEATRSFIQHLPFTYLHVFTYSARPGTPAAAMPGHVPVHIARERNRILRELSDQKKASFMRRFAGETVEAITLDSHADKSETDKREKDKSEKACLPATDPPVTEALTDNYLKLHLRGFHPSNQWLRARIESVEGNSLVGSLASAN